LLRAFLIESVRLPFLRSSAWRVAIFDPFRLGLESNRRPNLFAGEMVMGAKLYVGNLTYSMTNESLEQLFLEFGDVRSAQVIQDRETGRSKGFGFVEMVDSNAASQAISSLHDKEVDGRRLSVNEARPREPRSERSDGGGRGSRGY
jgi:cold-inducible RNA-binding protein